MLKVASCQICWLYATLEKIISRVLLHSQMLQNSCNQPPLPPFYGCSDFREEKLLYAETHSCVTLVKEVDELLIVAILSGFSCREVLVCVQDKKEGNLLR